ncbi:MAG TPA: hypothetical protein VEZ20_00925 [Allosphingosinicella sp.]|jgi:hypothetical protein|nr:hypothetical protein [Allosphingosinicella sp.]
MLRKAHVILARTSSVAIAIAALFACIEGRHPFIMVQLCLGDAENLALFRSEMAAAAKAEGMSFNDDEEATKRDLAIIDEKELAHNRAGPTIQMRMRAEDGLGATATNLGLRGYQVAIGFGEGRREPNAARAFSSRVIARLARHWQVTTVPAGSGAQPLPNCTSR